MGKKQAKRRLKKQQQKAAAEAPQNLYQHHQVPQPERPMPKVDKVALAVRVELAGQQMRAQRTKALASKAATQTSTAKTTAQT
jgi:hypothetical protein